MSKATAREQARDKAQEVYDLANLIRNAVDAGPEWEDQSAAIRAIRRALEGSAEVMIADRPETGLKSPPTAGLDSDPTFPDASCRWF
jgi:hypothetical protein